MSESFTTETPASRRRQLVVATVTLAVASFAHGLTVPLLALVGSVTVSHMAGSHTVLIY